MDDFSVFLPIEKVDAQSGMVWGYASTPSKDLQGEIVPLDAIKAALPDYMKWANIRVMHTNEAVGVTKQANVDAKGLYIGAKIVDPAAWRLCKEGVYKGFSIGGSKLEKVGDVVKQLRLTEISLVDRPANSDCRIDVCKIAGGVAFGGSMENQTSNDTLIEKALDTLKTIMKWGSGSLPAADAEAIGLTKAETDLAPIPAESDELTADELATLTAKFADGVDLEKREFSDKERKHLGSTGFALPDGSFPVQTVKDLENAVKAFGRASDPEKAKSHIVSRAKALNATHILPADWPGSTQKKESSIMDTELQKRFTAASKAAIGKAKDHLQKAMDFHGKACKSVNALNKCMGKADGGLGEGAAGHLSDIASHLTSMADHHELAMHALGKASAGWEGEKGESPAEGGEVAESVREAIDLIPQSKLTEGHVEGSSVFAGDSPYSAAAIAEMVKAAITPLQDSLTKLTEENAFMKGQMSVIEKQPGARGPRLFSGMDTTVFGDATAGVKSEMRKMANAVQTTDDPDEALRLTARMIGTQAANPKTFGKSITDPDFKGAFAGK